MTATSRQRAPLGQQVALDLLEEIVRGDFLPGEPLPTEIELAERHGVSRLTLREATGILRQKGLIEVRRGRGTFVRPMAQWSPLDPMILEAQAGTSTSDRASMENLLEARRLVEVGVAELAAARRQRAHLESLTASLQLMREAGDNVAQFVDGDLAFHDALMQAADNSLIGALFAPVRELLEDDRRLTSEVAKDRAAAIRWHQAILDAVAAGDADAAGRAMAEHLRKTEVAIRRVRRRDAATPGRDE